MIGIIGGTGLYNLEDLKILGTHEITTPFGKPSAPVRHGKIGDTEVCFLPRHGVHHELLPSEINYRANIWALKSAGVKRIINISATGSLEEELKPGNLALVSQYFDWTKGKRAASFFGEGLVAHISTAEPCCPALSSVIVNAARHQKISIHTGKTYACVEGPRLGTRAESFFLRKAGCHLVGMTNLPEAFLAKEAQLCYCTIAVATDYDCWMEDPSQHATLEKVLALYHDSLAQVKQLITTVLLSGNQNTASCTCGQSLKEAVLTQETSLDSQKKALLAFLRA